jgi:hypothetical protein
MRVPVEVARPHATRHAWTPARALGTVPIAQEAGP